MKMTANAKPTANSDTNIRKSSDISNVTFVFIIAVLVLIETILML